MDIKENWKEVQKVFGESFKSSFHCAVASVNEHGEPHVTPIGSLILVGRGHGYYFEEFPEQLPRNLEKNKQVCVLAVNSSRWFWIKSLFAGKFSDPPALRLHGTVGDSRKATEREIKLWHKRVRAARFTKGYAIMWKEMKMVRDINFSRIEPVKVGEMTNNLYN